MTMVKDEMSSNRIMVMAKVRTTFSDEGLSLKQIPVIYNVTFGAPC